VTITITGDTMVTATFVPQPDLFATKVVAPVAGVDLGDTVTYTITLANTGDITASGIVLRDVLPEGVIFRAFVPNSGAAHNAGIITWSGALSTGDTLTLIFTATVADDASLYNKAITNVMTFTSTNAGSGSAEATFTVKQQYKIMLPLVIRN
jgi:large repetitive protein